MNNTDIRFYDTCSLLLAGDCLPDRFVISSVTLNELENIKTAGNKDQEIKYNARCLLRFLENNPDRYEVIIHKPEHEITIKDFDITDDMRILSDAIYCNNHKYIDATIFVTNDLALKRIANLFFGDGMLESVQQQQDNYVGYKEVILDDSSLADFYQNLDFNKFDLLIGEYLIIYQDNKDNLVDIRAWTGETHRSITTKSFNSKWFGKISPYNGDLYQKLLFDSLLNNKITMIKGPAGSGKTLASLGFLMSEMDKGHIDKIIVFCNTVATANSAKLGYLPGDKNEKLLDSQIGNLLISKFGSKDGVQQLINSEKLILLPFSDLRGYDTTGMNAGIYISEAQNLDKTLIKLALQRIGEDCICIIDGDNRTQVDMKAYEGDNNGMTRASKVFRGHDIYGEVTLQKVYRSKIAALAEEI